MTQIQQLDAELRRLEKRCDEITDELSEYNAELDALQRKYKYVALRTEQKHLENDMYVLKNNLAKAKCERIVEVLARATSLDALPIKITTSDMDSLKKSLSNENASYWVSTQKHESGDSYSIHIGPHVVTVSQDIMDDPERLDIRQDPVADALASLTRKQKLDALSRLKAELAVDVGLQIPYNIEDAT